MNQFISYPYSKLFIYKIKESEAYLAVLSCLPANFVINHIRRHQDEIKPYQDINIAEKLNVDADTIATTCVTKPINIHLPSAPSVIYVKGDYIHIPPHKGIRQVIFEDEAQQFLQKKIQVKLSYNQ